RCKLSVPRAGSRRGDLDQPEIRRPAVPLARFGRDVSIGPDQRKLALEQLLHGEDDAQRRALPRHERRRQERESGRVVAADELTLGPGVNDREKQCSCDQQQCCHSSSKLAYVKQLSPLPLEVSLASIQQYCQKLWLNHGKIHRQPNSTVASSAQAIDAPEA